MFENIIKMYNALIAQNRSNAAWYINQDLEILLMQLTMPTGSIKSTGDSAVEKIVGQSGAPVYLPAGAYGNAEARLFNLPVRPIEQCGALGEKGDIVLMDASQYLWIERTGITRQSSMHVRFDYDETVFKFTWRARWASRLDEQDRGVQGHYGQESLCLPCRARLNARLGGQCAASRIAAGVRLTERRKMHAGGDGTEHQ